MRTYWSQAAMLLLGITLTVGFYEGRKLVKNTAKALTAATSITASARRGRDRDHDDDPSALAAADPEPRERKRRRARPPRPPELLGGPDADGIRSEAASIRARHKQRINPRMANPATMPMRTSAGPRQLAVPMGEPLFDDAGDALDPEPMVDTAADPKP